MIVYVTMSYEYEGGQACFIDFEDLSDEEINTILSIASFHKGRGDSDWDIEATFPEGNVHDLGHWLGLLEPQYFFTYLFYGRKRPDLPGTPMKMDMDFPRCSEIAPTDAFDRLPFELLERFTVSFREYLESDECERLENDFEVIFTPLFEKEVEARRKRADSY